jgi:hypothetical protein
MHRSLFAMAAALLVSSAAQASGTILHISSSGSTTPQSTVIGGDPVTALEIDDALAGDADEDGLELPGGEGNEGNTSMRALVNRSVATESGHGREAHDARRAARNPQLARSFDGVNFFDQRFSNKGNQFSVEPPDQALCVGNGFIVESANDVMRIFDTRGGLAMGPIDLNTFYGYPAAINRTVTPNTFGPSITDPICHYDRQLKRFFHVVLTLDRAIPTSQALSGRNHLDIAVSDTSNPTGSWTIFKLPVQNDGSQGTPNHGCVVGPRNGPFTPGPCLGDYPHIGADANGIYLTTNEFDLAGPFFRGSQIYGISKRALASHASSIPVALINTGDDADSPVFGFTVWPATSPGDDDGDGDGNGTEFLLSSDAVFNSPSVSTELIVWSLANTRSLDSASPAPVLNVSAVTVDQYGVPPKADQKVGDLPLRDCIADVTCKPKVTANPGNPVNPAARLDSNDSRMQQVTFARGLLWGALDTAVSVGGVNKAGIAYFVLNPHNGRISTQGTIAVAGNNVTYPAIGVTENGRGVIAFTLVGADHFPSAAFAALDAKAGAGPIHVAAEGKGSQDGFTGYRPFAANPRPRWGDYGAAASDGKSVWIASEYVGQSCTFAQYNLDPFGTCGGTRGPLGNWDTRISQIVPGDHDDD